MHKKIVLLIILPLLLATACSKDEIVDFTIPEHLAGTKWKSTTVADIDKSTEYVALSFTSSTTVEAWSKYIGESEQLMWTASFAISNDSITIQNEDTEITGIIDGKTMKLNFIFGKYLFSKQ